MTLIIGVLTDNFALVAADTRGGFGKGEYAIGDVKVTVSGDEPRYLDVLQKLHVSDHGEGLVGSAGTYNVAVPIINDGKALSGFDRDEQIQRELHSKLTNYPDYVNLTTPTEFQVEAFLHFFREKERFYVTEFSAWRFAFSRKTRRNMPKELLSVAIGTGAPAWTSFIQSGPGEAQWKALQEKAQTTSVTEVEILKSLVKAFHIAATLYEDVSAAPLVYVLHKTGPWTALS